MGPQNDVPRKNKIARKLRKRTTDSLEYGEKSGDLTDLSKISSISSNEYYMGMDKKAIKEWVDVVYKKDIKQAMKDKLLSIREGALLLAIFYNLGNVSQACFDLKIGMTNHKYWLKTNPVYREFFDSVQEHLIDLVETKLFKKAMVDEDFLAQKFYLESKAKDRGYSKDVQIQQNILPAQFVVDFSGPTQVPIELSPTSEPIYLDTPEAFSPPKEDDISPTSEQHINPEL